MPTVTAGTLCPIRRLYSSADGTVYKAESIEIMNLLGQSGGIIERTSIDEAYMDMSGVVSGRVEISAESDIPFVISLRARTTLMELFMPGCLWRVI